MRSGGCVSHMSVRVYSHTMAESTSAAWRLRSLFAFREAVGGRDQRPRVARLEGRVAGVGNDAQLAPPGQARCRSQALRIGHTTS